MTSGSAKVTGNGTIRSLYSNQSISVAPGDLLHISCWVKSTGTVGAGAITLSVVEFSETGVAATQSAGAMIAARAGSATFVQIGSTPTVGTVYTVPAGVTSIRVKLAVTAGAATGSTVWFDDISVKKTGLLNGNWMNGVFPGTTVAQDIGSTLNELHDGLGEGTTPAGTIRTPAQVRARGAAVRGSAVEGQNKSTALNTFLFNSQTVAPQVLTAVVPSLDAGTKLTGTVADGQLGPIRDLVNGQIESGANLIPNPGFERLGFVSNHLFVTEQKRRGARSLKLTANGVNYSSYGMFNDNVATFHVPVTPSDVYYYEIWYRGHASNLRHRNLRVDGTGGSFTITVGANTTDAIAFNATAATVRAALVGLASVGAGNATVTGANINVSPGLTMTFGVSVTGAISVTTTLLTGGGASLFNTTIFMQATSYNQNGTATGFPGVGATTADDDNGVWKKLSGYVTIPAGTVPLPTVSADFRLYMNYFMPNGIIYYFDDAFLARVTDSNQINKALYGPAANAPGNSILTAQVPNGIDATKLSGIIADGQIPLLSTFKIPQLAQDKVTGLPSSVPSTNAAGEPTLLTVASTLIDLATDVAALKVDREVTANQGKTISLSFVQLPNANNLPTTGSQTWSTQYLTGSGPTFGVTSGKAAWKSSGTRTARVLYQGAGTRQVFVSGTGGAFTLTVGANTTNALAWNASAATVQTALTGLTSVGAGNATVSGTITTSPGLTITLGTATGISGALSLTSLVTGGTATLSDGGETTLTDYQSLRGVLADPPSILGIGFNTAFTALARVSQDGISYVFARAYWASLGNLRGQIGYSNGGTETIWQTGIELTWSTELKFRLGVDDNPRAYQVFSGSTLVTRYDEGYRDFAALTALTSKATARTYVDNTGNRLTVSGTGGMFTLTVRGATTAAIAFNATFATVATSLNTALNTALGTTGVVYATVTGTAANAVGTPGGLVVTFSSKVPGLTVGNANLTVNPALLTGGSATVTNRYTWSGTAFVPSTATSGVGAASPLGATSRRFGAVVRTSGSNNSGTISSVAVSDNPPVIYAGSVARISRLSESNTGSLSTTDTAFGNNFFDDVDFESLDVDADLTTGAFTVTKSKMYMVSARVKLTSFLDANGYLNLQVWDGTSWALSQRGGSLWGADTGSFAIFPNSGFVLTGTWLQYLQPGQKVRLSAAVDRGSRANIFTGGIAQTYFTISALG